MRPWWTRRQRRDSVIIVKKWLLEEDESARWMGRNYLQENTTRGIATAMSRRVGSGATAGTSDQTGRGYLLKNGCDDDEWMWW